MKLRKLLHLYLTRKHVQNYLKKKKQNWGHTSETTRNFSNTLYKVVHPQDRS
jgi:hypothetical protein